MNISVIGLGKLGLCTAACFAAAGHKVFGYDLNDYTREKLKSRVNPIDETGLTELLEAAWSNLHVVDTFDEALASAEATLIIVPTPSLKDGRFSNEFVMGALKEIGPILRLKDSFHVIDVVSTVMPGSSDSEFRPLLEQLTGKRCGIDFGLAYNPEFIALGSVISNFLNPDMVLIGASDSRTGATLTELYRSTCKSDPTIAVMSLVNAEITKISLNCYVTMKISFANALAALCEQVPGAEIDVVTTAIGADSRVGSKYLKGGLGFGGPCFPRDNLAFQAFAAEHGLHAGLSAQVVQINNAIVERIAAVVANEVTAGATVALLGLSYKPGTHIIEESQPITLAATLSAQGYQVRVHDPKALAATRLVLRDAVDYFEDPYACVKDASAIAVLTEWPSFNALDWPRIQDVAREGCLLLDSWRVLKSNHASLSKMRYRALGIGC